MNSDDAFVAAVGWTCPAITDSVEVFAWGDAQSGAHDAVRTTPPTSERAVGPVDALRASSITRRNVAWSAARALWKSRAPLGAFAVASTYPVHNPHTAYTAIMSAASGELHAYVRDAMCPENPGAVPSDQRYCTAASRAA